MPKTKLGCMLSMIDNIDNLTGFFIINKKPSGSKDPFALRRAGYSIVQILMKLKLNISINNLFTEALKSYENTSKIIKLDLIDFIIDKVKFILKKQNLAQFSKAFGFMKIRSILLHLSLNEKKLFKYVTLCN